MADDRYGGGGLREKTKSLAVEHHVPGVAVGIFCGGQEHYAYHGVTLVENPLAVGASTLFQIGSTTKTYTATAIMRLAGDGKIGLDDPVRAYVPEFRVKDEAGRGRRRMAPSGLPARDFRPLRPGTLAPDVSCQ